MSLENVMQAKPRLVIFRSCSPADISNWLLLFRQNCPRRWLWNNEVSGIAEGLSFSLWFYLGIEELPMVTEETINASKTMPIGILIGIGTLVVVSFLTLFFSSAIAPGAHRIWQESSPLLTG